MAEISTAVFDQDVFDSGVFDSIEIAPVTVKMSVPKEMWNAEQGMTVSIFASIYSYGPSARIATPFNPPTPPEIELYDPFDVGVGFVPMVRRDDGVFLYQYFIGNLAWSGAYAARVRVVNGQISTITKKAVVFTV